MSVVLNRGDGTFAPSIAYAAGAAPRAVALADLNGDGKMDLVVAASQSHGGSSVNGVLNTSP